MIPTKTLLNFGVFIILVIRPRVSAVMVKYEEPFPPRLPVHVKSRVAFTQYGNIPMLSLEEIKNGFPWLEMSSESDTHREDTHRSTGSAPSYIFYYVPTEVTPHFERTAKSQLDHGDSRSKVERQNSFKDKNRNHRFYIKSNKSSPQPTELVRNIIKQITRNKKLNEKSINPKTEEEETRKFETHRNHDSVDQKAEYSKSKIRAIKGRRTPGNLPKNHRLRDGDLPVRNKFLKTTGMRSVPSNLYPKVPSRYMQPPMLKFEEKEFWVKNKRKSKRPFEDSGTNEDRLKNHRIVKQKKSKKLNPDNEKYMKNHKPAYDREHDPEEPAESSNGKVQRVRKRPKENPKNPSLVSQDGERIEFQIHGHEGPQTYIFGYDTGNGENRHFRLEERLRDGSVKGHYGYYDSDGKLKMVEYQAKPMGGYEEKHHESASHHSNKENHEEIKS